MDLDCVFGAALYYLRRFALSLAVVMTDDPLDAMKWRWSYIQGYLFPSMREDNDPITEALGRLVTTLDVIGREAFVPDRPGRRAGRPRIGAPSRELSWPRRSWAFPPPAP